MTMHAKQDSASNLEIVDRSLSLCPICDSEELAYSFMSQGGPVSQCRGCRLMFLNPQPSDEELAQIYSTQYFLGAEDAEEETSVSEMKRETARLYLAHLARYRATPQGGTLLEIGCGNGDFLLEAERTGFAVLGSDVSPHAAAVARSKLRNGKVLSGDIEEIDLGDRQFDVCILSDVLEHTRHPRQFLTTLHEHLTDDGVILITTPSLDSWSARVLKTRWMEFKKEHLYYFDRQTIQHLLFRCGFEEVVIFPYPVSGISSLVRVCARMTPPSLRQRHFPIAAGGMCVMARKRSLLPQRKLSVVMPVYNERKTFSQVMDQLLSKDIAGLDREIVVVESNSTDGSREEVLRYQNHPGVTVILEDSPKGKGHAVRTGLQHCTGDFILIQDADLEYDLNDYELLLAPLRSCREAFVLGSRHSDDKGVWKMRQFDRHPVRALLLNGGHLFFTTLINVLFRQRLRDPFTMFKVFRRDCLYGLSFECDRFDFDYELLIKLIRKGYQPREIPVNYTSRSFAEGKKVSLWRDPLTWIRALVKYRLLPSKKIVK